MKKLSLLIASCCLISPPAIGRDDEHLVPEDSVFSEYQPRWSKQYYDDYEENVLRFFSEAFEKEIFARVVVYPSFSPEYVIAISRDDRDYKLHYLEAGVMLWPFEDLEEALIKEAEAATEEGRQKAREVIEDLRSYVPESRDKVSVNRCESALPPAIGTDLHTLWSEMLFRTRYPDRRPVAIGGEIINTFHLDGTAYHFSFEYDHTRLTGKTWSPEDDSINGKFVALTDILRKGCVERSSDFFKDLENKVENLSSDLEMAVY